MSLTVEEPIELFRTWLADASKSEPNDPNAMSLATVDAEGMPSLRMVLLKSFDEHGFVFYTNLGSRKGHELAANPKAALCFHWKSLLRQVRVQGHVEPVSAAEADAYFASRERDKRIGAWASRQSEAMEGRWELEKRVAAYALKFGLGTIPRPEFWSGYRVVPERIEFWKAHPFRLHERIVCTAKAEGGWDKTTLFP